MTMVPNIVDVIFRCV